MQISVHDPGLHDESVQLCCSQLRLVEPRRKVSTNTSRETINGCYIAKTVGQAIVVGVATHTVSRVGLTRGVRY